jgi:hypothetical protein
MPIRTVSEYLKRWGITLQRPGRQVLQEGPPARHQRAAPQTLPINSPGCLASAP